MNVENTIHQGNSNAEIGVLFAHGAGAGMHHVFMAEMAARIASDDIQVIRFNFPYMMKNEIDGKKRPPDRLPVLLAYYQQLIEQMNVKHLFIAGKSMGGRVASHLLEHEKVTAGICLGYPFHPPGKPEKLRTAHLELLQKPLLIIQGERDTFGRHSEVMNYPLSRYIQTHWVPDGDHGLKPRKSSGFTEEGNFTQAADVISTFIQAQIQ